MYFKPPQVSAFIPEVLEDLFLQEILVGQAALVCQFCLGVQKDPVDLLSLILQVFQNHQVRQRGRGILVHQLALLHPDFYCIINAMT